MYRPASSTTSNLSFPNGHLSPPVNTFTNPELSTSDSESDLSEAVDVPNTSTLSSNPEAQEVDGKSQSPRMNTESSHDEDAIGSDDADYDIETPAPPDPTIVRDDASSSEDSRRYAKRKVGVEHHDYTMDPELYGLRRSVGLGLASARNLLTSSIRVVLVHHGALYGHRPFFTEDSNAYHRCRLTVTLKTMKRVQISKVVPANDENAFPPTKVLNIHPWFRGYVAKWCLE